MSVRSSYNVERKKKRVRLYPTFFPPLPGLKGTDVTSLIREVFFVCVSVCLFKNIIIIIIPSRTSRTESHASGQSSEPSPGSAEKPILLFSHTELSRSQPACSLQQAPTSKLSPSSGDITGRYGNSDSTPVRSWTYLSDYLTFHNKPFPLCMYVSLSFPLSLSPWSWLHTHTHTDFFLR